MDLLVKNSSFQQPSIYRRTYRPEAVYTTLNSALYSPDSNFNHSLNSIYVASFQQVFPQICHDFLVSSVIFLIQLLIWTLKICHNSTHKATPPHPMSNTISMFKQHYQSNILLNVARTIYLCRQHWHQLQSFHCNQDKSQEINLMVLWIRPFSLL